MPKRMDSRQRAEIIGVKMRTKLYWCKMGKCFVELARTERGAPICFGKGGLGNVCEEHETQFAKLPFEPVIWWLKYSTSILKGKLATGWIPRKGVNQNEKDDM